jgi:hypothetical protein
MQFKKQRQTSIKKKQQSLGDTQTMIKHTNIYIMEAPKVEKIEQKKTMKKQRLKVSHTS